MYFDRDYVFCMIQYLKHGEFSVTLLEKIEILIPQRNNII